MLHWCQLASSSRYNSHIKTNPKSSPSAGSLKQTDIRLGRIVRLLMDHATVVVSGTKIADEIGISRSEVWRLIQQLRSLGVDVAGHPATGYQLRSVPDLLLPEILAPMLSGTIFASHIQHYYKIGSTNTEAMLAGAAGAAEGTVIVAEEQLAGRGRGSNTWYSARSAGIYCSVLLRPDMPPSEALLFSLAAGLAVTTAVVELAPQLQPDLKWPNDVQLNGKKFCGILTEMHSEATRVQYLVTGIGINVNQATFPAELRDIATSLRIQTGTELSRVELCAALLKSLDREYQSLRRGGGERQSVLRRFEENSSSVRGSKMRVMETGLQGVSEGLDHHGFLQLRTPEGLRTVLSGTVTVGSDL